MKIERIDEITDEMWLQVCDFNRDMVDEYLCNQTQLAKKTKLVYSSSLRIFFYWVKDYLNNKKCIDIKKREFSRYLNWLTNRGLSESAIKLKKSVVSAFCNYIMMIYEEDYPTFRSFVTKEMKVVQTGYIHKKEPLTPDEYLALCAKLGELGEWQKLAYLMFSYSTGCRRAEARQLLKEVVNYTPKVKMIKVKDKDGVEQMVESKSYKTHDIRCKGKSIVGKVRKLQFGEDVMVAFEKWLEVRGEDDCPYMFVTKRNSEIHQVGEETFNYWCSNLFTKLVGRRVHPHLFRESRATNLVVYEHKSVEVAQKLLGHNDSSTTTKHYIIREDEDDADEAFV